MSMENAILELAAAINRLADSAGATAEKAARFTEQVNAVIAGGAPVDDVSKTKPETPAKTKPEVKAAPAAAVEPDAELEQAVEQVEVAAKEETASAAAPAATLDYKADVYPKLIALAKAKGKPALLGLLKEFNAATGDALKAEQYAAVVARAAQLAA